MRFLCVHQGYELYGSDRAFIDSVAAMREAWAGADIEVVVPRQGPIVPPLAEIASRVVVEPIFVIRRRDIAKLIALGLFRIGPALWRAIRRLRAHDLVYVNTIVVIDYLLAARFFAGKVVVHVHEIPEGLALKIFRRLLIWSRAEVIFNSRATQAAFSLPAHQSHHVVYNSTPSPSISMAHHDDGSHPLRLLMLGRINRIKGQDVLIEALASLPKELAQRLEVRIVGGSFGDDAARETLLRGKVRAAGLEHAVRFEPFHDDPAPLYQWADVVLVPSKSPESLGRVAIEAMAFGRPPVVSAIGGLVEVVEDGVTGWHVPPNDPAALARKITDILMDPAHWRGFPAAARSRYAAMFGPAAIAKQIQAIIRNRLMANGVERPARSLARI
jgi:glycosyltransferase involved in cell wall biosynthesis